jgi:STE24 endopeptidase
MSAPRILFIFLSLAFCVCAVSPARAPAAVHALGVLQNSGTANSQPAQSPSPSAEAPGRIVTAYSLPPALFQKAHNFRQIVFWSEMVTSFYSMLVLIVMLRWKLAATFRDWAERVASARFLQAAVFAPLFVITFDLFLLPLRIARHVIGVRFGLSIQGWGSWLWDWTKGELIVLVLGTLLAWLLYGVIRHSPRRWWFYFWLFTLPLLVLFVFLLPLVLEPMFYKYLPLAEKDPALAAALESMVQRAGKDIPVERMFWMGASEKSTALDAYVTGVGASKRIVVWDTTIAKMTTPQIVAVAGHEMGHYVLNHIWKGLAAAAALLFFFFYLGYRLIGWMLARWGSGWGIRAVDDWASLPALLILLMLFDFCASPIESGFSRYLEHQADQYGLEVTHGLTPDSGQVAAQAFQILGEVDLSDPAPNPVDVFLFYDHPPIADRVRFSLTYDPWSKGQPPEFVH